MMSGIDEKLLPQGGGQNQSRWYGISGQTSRKRRTNQGRKNYRCMKKRLKSRKKAHTYVPHMRCLGWDFGADREGTDYSGGQPLLELDEIPARQPQGSGQRYLGQRTSEDFKMICEHQAV